jgi:hypothetical protein
MVMTRALTRLPVRPLAAAFLLALGLLGPAGRAEAACGDYVAIDGRAADHPAPPPGEPCHGPDCTARQSPPPTPLVPPTSPNPLPKDLAAAAATPDLPTPAFDSPTDPPAGRPVRRPSAPFHPPRPA